MQNNSAILSFIHAPSTAFLMALISGLTDVTSFIGASKLFTAHITGNIVIVISQLISHEKGVASKILALPLFILIVALITFWIEFQGRKKRILSFCLFVEAFLLALFMIAGLTIFPHFATDSYAYIFCALFGVYAMSIHNTLLRIYMSHFPPCTVMTVNLTQFIIDVVSFTKPERYEIEPRKESHLGIKKFGNVLLGFIVGGGIAAVGYVYVGFWVLTIDIFLVCYLGIRNLSHS